MLLQNHRGAATKPPGCCYKNHRGPMPGVSGYQRMRNSSSHNSCNFAFFHVLGGGTLCKLKTKRISGLCVRGKSQDGGGALL